MCGILGVRGDLKQRVTKTRDSVPRKRIAFKEKIRIES